MNSYSSQKHSVFWFHLKFLQVKFLIMYFGLLSHFNDTDSREITLNYGEKRLEHDLEKFVGFELIWPI